MTRASIAPAVAAARNHGRHGPPTDPAATAPFSDRAGARNAMKPGRVKIRPVVHPGFERETRRQIRESLPPAGRNRRVEDSGSIRRRFQRRLVPRRIEFHN